MGCPSLTGTSGLSAYQNSALATSGDRRSGRRRLRIEILPEARQEDRTRRKLPLIPHPVNLRYSALPAPDFVVPKRILPEPSTHHSWVLPSALKQPTGTEQKRQTMVSLTKKSSAEIGMGKTSLEGDQDMLAFGHGGSGAWLGKKDTLAGYSSVTTAHTYMRSYCCRNGTVGRVLRVSFWSCQGMGSNAVSSLCSDFSPVRCFTTRIPDVPIIWCPM